MEALYVKQGYYRSHAEGPGSSWVDTSYTQLIYFGEDHAALASLTAKAIDIIHDRLLGHVEAKKAAWMAHHMDVAAYKALPFMKRLFKFYPNPPDDYAYEYNMRLCGKVLEQCRDLEAQLVSASQYPSLFRYEDNQGTVQTMLQITGGR
jgi:hypothetical protein